MFCQGDVTQASLPVILRMSPKGHLPHPARDWQGFLCRTGKGLGSCRFAGLRVCGFAGLRVCGFAGLRVDRVVGQPPSVSLSQSLLGSKRRNPFRGSGPGLRGSRTDSDTDSDSDSSKARRAWARPKGRGETSLICVNQRNLRTKFPTVIHRFRGFTRIATRPTRGWWVGEKATPTAHGANLSEPSPEGFNSSRRASWIFRADAAWNGGSVRFPLENSLPGRSAGGSPRGEVCPVERGRWRSAADA